LLLGSGRIAPNELKKTGLARPLSRTNPIALSIGTPQSADRCTADKV
jgi:hypothetical protein